MDLINVSNVDEVINAIGDHTSLSTPSKAAIAATVLTLAEIQHAFDQDGSLSTFLADQLLVLPPRAKCTGVPGRKVQRCLRDITVVANKAAESLYCSSILAGEGNENDDTGDVALWLGSGDYGPGQEENVLHALELTSWIEQGAKVSRVELTSCKSTLPSNLADKEEHPEVDALVQKLFELENRHCFRVSSLSTAPLVVFFLLGCIVKGEKSEWGGLIGVGIWSDQ